MDQILTRQLTISIGELLTLSIPRAQLLNLQFRRDDGTPAEKGAESIEIRTSVGRFILNGNGLSPLWEKLVSGENEIEFYDQMEGGGRLVSYITDLPSKFLMKGYA